jgi:hypothetical protein
MKYFLNMEVWRVITVNEILLIATMTVDIQIDNKELYCIFSKLFANGISGIVLQSCPCSVPKNVHVYDRYNSEGWQEGPGDQYLDV